MSPSPSPCPFIPPGPPSPVASPPHCPHGPYSDRPCPSVPVPLSPSLSPQSLVIPEKFQHILRVLNTNIDGRRKIAFAITAIKVRGQQNLGTGGGHTGVSPRPPLMPLSPIQGVGRRYAHVVLRKADIDLTKRAGELTEDEVRGLGTSWGFGDILGTRGDGFGVTLVSLCPPQVERVITIMQNPRQYKIPDWFLNRQKDVKDGKYSQVRGQRGAPGTSPLAPEGFGDTAVTP